MDGGPSFGKIEIDGYIYTIPITCPPPTLLEGCLCRSSLTNSISLTNFSSNESALSSATTALSFSSSIFYCGEGLYNKKIETIHDMN